MPMLCSLECAVLMQYTANLHSAHTWHLLRILLSSQQLSAVLCAAQNHYSLKCQLLVIDQCSGRHSVQDCTACVLLRRDMFKAQCVVQEPVPGIGPSPPEFNPPERANPSPPVPEDDPMRPLPPQQPEIPPNERCY